MKIQLVFFAMFFCLMVSAQEDVTLEDVNVDDLGIVNDAFKENFFDALSEKARGNHDRAIEKLLKCEKLEPESGAVQLELAKNYMASNAFAKAESHLLKTIQLSGEREWILDTLLENYESQKQYDKALSTLKKLIDINDSYRELLPIAYLKVEDESSALQALDALDRDLGPSDKRNRLRRTLQKTTATTGSQPVIDLEERLSSNPKNSDLYAQLMYAYSQTQDEEKMLSVAARWRQNIPSDDQPYLALYKIYLNRGDIEKGLSSLVRVLKSSQLDDQVKSQVITDYLNAIESRPELASQVDEIMKIYESQIEDTQAFIALGNFYKEKNQLNRAVRFYQMALDQDDQDFDLIKITSLLYLDLGKFDDAATISEQALEIYPAQSLLYLINGAALNQLQEYKKAITVLETGLSFLLDEPQLEKDIYEQLLLSYEKLGDNKKAASLRETLRDLN
ncbi:tetratricopeptide repeat protein [Nonlabens ponticola]|uniref:Uncharacterized protein n=1 Tax=Nonlabens ponticola TaxID=2496866 RepID=A0A3S9MVR3_9FLAO|nr:hypothetical protein [Nonlabens ponticola]AZQ43232.1 hypothetical protein EJ995_02895 [Nonlabens ponticola]